MAETDVNQRVGAYGLSFPKSVRSEGWRDDTPDATRDACAKLFAGKFANSLK